MFFKPLYGKSRFTYLDITGNYGLGNGFYLFLRYTDGGLAPVYELDNAMTMGFRYEIMRRE